MRPVNPNISERNVRKVRCRAWIMNEDLRSYLEDHHLINLGKTYTHNATYKGPRASAFLFRGRSKHI